MRFERIYLCELPFMLNISAGAYDILLRSETQQIQIHQEQYAIPIMSTPGHFDYSIGTQEELKIKYGKDSDDFERVHKIRLRTLVKRSETISIKKDKLLKPSSEELAEEYLGIRIRKRLPIPTNISKPSQINWAVDEIEKCEKHEYSSLHELTAKKLTSHSILPPNPEDFISLLNHFLRMYMVHFDDPFVEEISFYQLGSSPIIPGVQVQYLCETRMIDSSIRVEKIPPIMRTQYTQYPEDKINSFLDLLGKGKLPDPIDIIAVRAMGLFERGANRSAIIEAAAALETSVARRIRRDFISKGMTESEIENTLRNHQKFSDRCKKVMKKSSGFTVPAIKPQLWGRVINHRENYRHKIVHSELEPPPEETKFAVSDFVELAKTIQDYVV